MIITDVKCHALDADVEQEVCFSQAWIRRRTAAIIEVSTDEGITGWGESLCHGGQPVSTTKTIIEEYLRDLVIGKDPFDVEVIWETIYNTTRPIGQQGIMINALSGIDIALWDIIGKALGKPVHKLIGGAFRSSVPAYATGFYRKKDFRVEDGIEEAFRHLEEGFHSFKLKIGFGVKEDIDYIHSIREAVGPDCEIMADANCAYNSATARRILYETECDNLLFFEEPIPPEDIEGFKELKTLTKTYLATGENIFTKIGFRRYLAEHVVDIIQPELCSSGGITELKKIAVLAQAYNTMIIPHVWGTGIGQAASLQLLASLPPAPLSLTPLDPMLEYDCSEHPFRHKLVFNALNFHDGVVDIPCGPGLGVDVNKEILEQFEI